VKVRIALLGLAVASSVSCAGVVGKPREPRRDPHPPATLTEALDRLEQTLPPETIQRMRDGSEADMCEYHFSVGLWMRNYWGLWAEGPPYRHLAGLGLIHPDDMSGVILRSFRRRLHGEPLRVEDEAARYQEYWRVARDPDPGSNPACSGTLTTTLSMSSGADDERVRGVHMGTCCADGRVWSYHLDRGWYTPTETELAIWNKGHGYDPCKQ
jgi:hypothetical protein